MMQLVMLWSIVRSPNLVPRKTPDLRGGPVAAPWSNGRPLSIRRPLAGSSCDPSRPATSSRKRSCGRCIAGERKDTPRLLTEA